MRSIIGIISLALLSFVASPALAGHLDDIEDAAEDYRKAVKSLRKDFEKDRAAPPYLVQLTHRLEHAADVLEELADDNHPLPEILGAYEEVAALHHRLSELTYDGAPFGGRHTARRLEKLHRHFGELAAEVERGYYPPSLGYRSPAPWFGSGHELERDWHGHHRFPSAARPPHSRHKHDAHPRHRSRSVDPHRRGPIPSRVPAHALEHQGRHLERSIRSQLLDAALSHLFH